MRRQTANECQAGHKVHDTKVVDTVLGPFTIWDWEKYAGFEGYCTGQDDVSMTLDLYGIWEAPDWQRAQRYVEGREGWALDFGSHIGWYAVMFARAGLDVLAVDADPVNCELLEINAGRHRVKIDVHEVWVADMMPLGLIDTVLIKSDVEGAEDDVLEVCRYIIAGLHPALLLECSPEFDTYYPQMIDDLIGLGYRADVEGVEITGATLGDTQKNVWFE
ncbi:MAG: hypothetical protein V3U46_10020 [Acidimicrobiia bacterium]